MNELELFEQARRRVQNKIKGRCVTNKDVIVDQEKEIIYYRKKIQKIMNENKTKQSHNIYEKQFEININDEDYIIEYNNELDIVMINAYIIKIVYDKDIVMIAKDKQFRITNKNREEKRNTFWN